MAANSKSVQVIGKHIVNGVYSRTFSRAVTSGLFASRNGHTSTYDKNVEEDFQSSKVPDELIKHDSDKYWSPHPQTGIFGPSSSSSSIRTTDENCGSQEQSVMEEKAWFRPTSLEDLDKTHHS